jgi:hypothetical protein
MQKFILLQILCCLPNLIWGQQTKSLDSVSYFPKSIYSEVGNRIDSMSFIWRSRMLKEFNEPRLISQQETNSVYRFTWTRSFHEKMVIRLVLSTDTDTDTGILITKIEIRQLIKPSKKKNRAIIDDKLNYRVDSTKIEKAMIIKFKSLINERGLWIMKNSWHISAIHDGAGWLLEARDQEKGYQMLYRHSPDEQKEANFRSICLFLIQLTRDSQKLEIY